MVKIAEQPQNSLSETVNETDANYTPTYFGISMPEVTGIRENDDGTMTLTVEAV